MARPRNAFLSPGRSDSLHKREASSAPR